jgi:hypothetical protein
VKFVGQASVNRLRAGQSLLRHAPRSCWRAVIRSDRLAKINGNTEITVNKTQYRNEIRTLLQKQVGTLSLDEKLAIVRECVIELQKAGGFDESNKGAPWTDDEIRVVLQHSPTKENCIRLARGFRRGYGSIELIFRWAASTEEEVATKRPVDAHIQRVKRIAREIGWRAT